MRFLGRVSDEELVALYRGALAFVDVPLYEGFGYQVLEAMACGAPVVASSTTSIPEVVGDAGLLCDPLDADAIAAALRRVLDDPGDMRERGLAQAARFTWEKTGEGFARGAGPGARVIAYLHQSPAVGAVERYVEQLLGGLDEEAVVIAPAGSELARAAALRSRRSRRPPSCATSCASCARCGPASSTSSTCGRPPSSRPGSPACRGCSSPTTRPSCRGRTTSSAGRSGTPAGRRIPEVIYTSESDRETDGRKGVVIPLGIDLARFSVEPRAHDGLVVGNVARLVEQKDQRTLVEAAPAILERFPDDALRDRGRRRAARRARGGRGRAPVRAHRRARRRARAARRVRRVRVPVALRGPLPRSDRGAGGRSPCRRDAGRRDPRDRRGRRDGPDRAGGRPGRARRGGLPAARGPRPWPRGSPPRRAAACSTRFSVETMVERTVALYG